MEKIYVVQVIHGWKVLGQRQITKCPPNLKVRARGGSFLNQQQRNSMGSTHDERLM
jgi:hypothetical protein